MAELIQTYAEVVRDARGAEYTAHAYGEGRDDAARPRRARLLGLGARTRLPRRSVRARVLSAREVYRIEQRQARVGRGLRARLLQPGGGDARARARHLRRLARVRQRRHRPR